jgi:hypothetical protein
VNRELILLYWSIGRQILVRQREDGWGTKVIERLATDLRSEFPDMKGLSFRNLGYMKAFAEAWPDESILQQLAAKLPLVPQLRPDRQIKDKVEHHSFAQEWASFRQPRLMGRMPIVVRQRGKQQRMQRIA